MTARRAAPFALLAVVGATGAIALTGQDDGYSVHVPLADAAGLRQGSDVSMGGVDVGSVSMEIDDDDRVDLELKLGDGHGPIPKDARIAIVASNLLGQKHVEIVGGSTSRPAEDGARLNADQVSVGTDLDQVLNVLDADTRTRLAILLNEAGTSVAGRKVDIARILDELPTAFSQATVTVQQLVKDNKELGTALAATDSFIEETTSRRKELTRLVDRLGGATETLASRRAGLRGTLAAAPRTLTQLRAFLGDLQRTTVPLGPAAREISAAAPLLDGLLDEVEPLRLAADPTLRTATKVAPDLTKLAQGATPVVRRAAPTADALQQLAQSLAPLSATLGKSSDNLLATADNWTRAIQFRDGLSHVFRGEASFSPDVLASVIKRLAPEAEARRRPGSAKGGGTPTVTPPSKDSGSKPTAPAQPSLPDVTKPLKGALDRVTGNKDDPVGKTVDEALDAITGAFAPKQQPSGPLPSDPEVEGLLDFLLR